jgi:hypothetical protein
MFTPFPLSFLPENVKKRLKDYAYNNPTADSRMPGSRLPDSANNPFITPYAGPPEYDGAWEVVPDNAIPLSSYKLQNIPKLNAKIEDVMGTTVPIPNPDLVNPETLEYDPFTGLPVKKQFDKNILPNLDFATDEPQVKLDIFPYNDDVEYIRSQRQQEPEIPLPPKYEWYGDQIFEIIPETAQQKNDKEIRRTGYMVPVPKPVPKPETNTEIQTPNNKFGLAEGYYLGNAMLNASAAINNMVQPEPPSIQAKIPHFERQRLNPEPYDNMRSQIRDQGTQAYRLQRENISQASDLMKGLAAVTSGTQQGLMNIGMQQAGAEQQIQNANQQISMQEQSMQTDVLNNEAVTNWKIQDEFYKTKGQAISSALAAMSQTGGQYAKYKTMQDMVSKQDAINKSAAEVNNQMQASLLEYQLAESALSSQEYQDYYKSQRSAEQERINKELLGDDKYKSFNDYYNGVIPSYSSYQYNIDSPESQEKLRTVNVAKRFQSEYPLGAAPDETKFVNDPDGYKAAVAQYNKYKEYNDKYNNDPRYKAYEAEQAFWKEALEKFNESTLKKSTAETYLKSRNLRTQSEVFERLKSISERGAQSFE